MVATALTRVVCEIPRSRRWLILAWTLLLAASAQTVHADVVLQGVVTDRDTGAPVVGAEIHRGSASGTLLALTDANGMYTVDGSQLGSSSTGGLSARMAGYFVSQVSYSITSVPTTVDVTLLAHAGPIFEGTVRNEATGDPIAGAQVRISGSGSLGEAISTDSNGAFAFDATHFRDTASAGFRALMFVSAPGYFTFSGPSTDYDPPFPILQDVYLQASSDVALQGTVTDRDTGAPVVGAEIRRGSASGTLLALTDANGMYTVDGSQLGSSSTGGLSARMAGYFVSQVSYTITSVPTTVDVTLLAHAGPIFEGTVRNEATGDPIAGAQVRISGGGSLGEAISTDSNGAFAFDATYFRDTASAGFRALMFVSAPGYFTFSGPSTDYHPPFPVSQDVTLLATNGVVLQGTVTDRDTGAPVVGAEIHRGSASGTLLALTDANGMYTVDGSQLGSSSTGGLSARMAGYFVSQVAYTITSVPTTVDVTLLAHAGPIFEGTVRNEATGDPIAGAQVRISGGGSLGEAISTDSNGAFAFDATHFLDTASAGFRALMFVSAPGYFTFSGPSTDYDPPFPITQDVNLTWNGTTRAITIETHPPGLNVNVDGVDLMSPQSFDWIPGSVHTVVATSPQTMAGTSYAFTSWSNGGAASQIVATPNADTVYTANFEVSNQPPVANISGPSAGLEGGTVVLDASGSSDPEGTVLSYAWDLDGDGSFDDASGSSANLTAPDNGAVTVSLRVTDEGGLSDTASTTVTFINVAPTVDAGADQSLPAGADVSVSATFGDPGAADTHSATIDWGDGTLETIDLPASPPGTVRGTHTYAVAGAYPVTVMVTDDDGASHADTLLAAHGLATDTAKLFVGPQSSTSNSLFRYDVGVAGSPLLDLTLTHASFLGSCCITFSETGEMFVTNISAPGGAGVSRFLDPREIPSFNGTIVSGDFAAPLWSQFRNGELLVSNWGQSSVLRFTFDASGNAMPNGAVTAGLDNRIRGVGVHPTTGELFVSFCCGANKIERFVFDADGNAVPNGSIAVGGLSSPHDIAFSPWGEMFVVNPGSNSVSRYLFDPADLTGPVAPNGQITGGSLNGPLGLDFSPWGELFVGSFRSPLVSRWLFDTAFNAVFNGSFATPTSVGDVQFAPVNQPPVADIGGPYVVPEGTTVVLEASGSSDPEGTPLTFAWDLDGDGVFDDAAGPVAEVASLDDALLGVSLRVADESGLTDTAHTTVTFVNVAPTIDAGADQTVLGPVEIFVAATFTDPGTLDTHTATVDWGDGSPVEPVAVDPASSSVSASHVFQVYGDYEVAVTVTDDDGQSGVGRLTVTRFPDSSTFTELPIPAGTGEDAGDRFGFSVDIDGPFAVVGAPRHNAGANPEQGAAYVFELDPFSGQWELVDKLTAPLPADTDHFGFSVAVHGGTIAVGARLREAPPPAIGVQHGAVFVFERFSAEPGQVDWRYAQELTASDAQPGDFFGLSVALADDELLVGAPGDDDRGTNAGAAYRFTRTTIWEEVEKLVPPTLAAYDLFGQSVAFGNGLMAVGAPGDTFQSDSPGAVFVFDAISGANTMLTGSEPDGQFGASVSAEGDVVLVGAPYEAARLGHVYAYERDGSGGFVASPLVPTTATPNLRVGSSVGLSGEVAITGGPFAGEAAFLFERRALGDWGPDTNQDAAADDTLALSSSPVQIGNDFGTAVSMSGSHALVGAPFHDARGAVFLFGQPPSGLDFDLDGIGNGLDNCPTAWNPDQLDANGDGFGDACVSTGASVGSGATVGTGTIIQTGATIAKDAAVGDYSVIESGAILEKSAVVGSGTVIESGAEIKADATVGDKVVIGSDAIVGQSVTIGDESRVKSEVVLDKEVRLKKRVIIEERVALKKEVLVDDDSTVGIGTVVEKGAVLGIGVRIGANVTIGPDVVLGDYVIVGDDSVIGTETVVGDRTVLGNRASVGHRVEIGADVTAGMDVRIEHGARVIERSVLAPGARVPKETVYAKQPAPLFALEWGGIGPEPERFLGPEAVAVDAAGQVYVLDAKANAVKKFDADGGLMQVWTTYAKAQAIAVDPAGRVYVAGSEPGTIAKFDADGQLLLEWTIPANVPGIDLRLGARGGELVVSYSDGVNPSRVEVFDAEGNLLETWLTGFATRIGGIALGNRDTVLLVHRGQPLVHQFDRHGVYLGAWDVGVSLVGIAADMYGDIYLTGIGRMVKLTEEGYFRSSWGAEGSGPGEFTGPIYPAVDDVGHVYTLTPGDGRVQKFVPATP